MSTTTKAERRRHRFRPTLWSTVASATVLAVLIGLGTWQVHRLQWKEGVIAHREARLALPPVSVGGDSPAEADLAFRRARATGRLLHSDEFLIGNRVRGGRAGYEVVTPLRLGPADLILVNRGWVPLDRAEPETRREGQIVGNTTIAGLLRRPGKSNRWIPDNDPPKGVWFYADPRAMAAVSGLQGIRDVVLVADEKPNPGGLPAGRAPKFEISNRHLEYALTWYGLALVLVAIYVVFHWRREDVPDEPG